jgi:hypothetical protein
MNQIWSGNKEAGHPEEVLGREPELVSKRAGRSPRKGAGREPEVVG